MFLKIVAVVGKNDKTDSYHTYLRECNELYYNDCMPEDGVDEIIDADSSSDNSNKIIVFTLDKSHRIKIKGRCVAYILSDTGKTIDCIKL